MVSRIYAQMFRNILCAIINNHQYDYIYIIVSIILVIRFGAIWLLFTYYIIMILDPLASIQDPIRILIIVDQWSSIISYSIDNDPKNEYDWQFDWELLIDNHSNCSRSIIDWELWHQNSNSHYQLKQNHYHLSFCGTINYQ